MNRRLVFALIGGTMLAGPVLAADLPPLPPLVKAPLAAPAYLAEWSGIYVGLEGGYGWGRDAIDPSVGGFGGSGNIASILNNGGVLFPDFGPLGISSVSQSGGLAGGFFGIQKQLGSWVFGLEADMDASWINGSASASPTAQNQVVSAFVWGLAPVSVTTNPGQTITVPGQVVTSTGTVTTLPVNINIPGQTINSSGTIPAQTITIPVSAVTGIINPGTTSVSFTINISLGFLGTIHIPVGPISIPISGTVSVPGQTILVTIPSQPISVTGSTVAATVTVPGQTVPVSVTGTVLPQTISLNGITSSGSTTTNVLQQFQALTTVSRTASLQTKIDELGSLRAKIGYAFSPNLLFYGTAGLAFAHVQNNLIATESFSLFGTTFSQTSAQSGTATLFGLAAGAGFDYRFTGTSFIVGAEYLHYEFPSHTISVSDNNGGTTLTQNRESADAVKGRFTYMFPIH
jgi:opacity protein-like surface antigen